MRNSKKIATRPATDKPVEVQYHLRRAEETLRDVMIHVDLIAPGVLADEVHHAMVAAVREAIFAVARAKSEAPATRSELRREEQKKKMYEEIKASMMAEAAAAAEVVAA